MDFRPLTRWGVILPFALLTSLRALADHTYSMDWFTVSNGGDVSSSGDGRFSLGSTSVAPPDAGSMLGGGRFALAGGYLSSSSSTPPTFFGPTSGNPTYARAAGLALKINIADLFANNVVEPNGFPVSLSSVGGSAQNATIFLDSRYIYYYPANNNSDSFTYTVTDSLGNTATGTITINLVNPGGIAQSITITGGVATINFAGIPNFQYDVQRSTDLQHWTTLETITAPAAGVFSYRDANPPQTGAVFYRLIQH